MISKHTLPPLSAEDERNAVIAGQAGNAKERDRVILANLRFAIKKIREARRIAESDDLEQEVVVGMLEAFKRFDVSRGVRFITYATSYILVGIENAEIASRNIRLPPDAFKAAIGRVVVRRDRPLSDASTCAAQIAAHGIVRLDDVAFRWSHDRTNPTLVHELIADPVATAEPDDTEDRAREVLLRTTPLEKLVLTRLFWDEKTFEDIGREIGVVYQRVTQLRDEAVERLRKHGKPSVPLASDGWWSGEAFDLRRQFEGRAVKFNTLRSWATARYAIHARRYLLHLLAWMALEGRAEWFGDTVRFGGRRAKLASERAPNKVAV